MEQVKSIINNIPCHDMLLKKEKNIPCTCYDMISKREYAKLLNQLQEWNVFAPKAIVKKYGVLTVQTAIEYTKATPNVRVPGAYFTYMVRQLKTQKTEQPQSNLRALKQEMHTNTQEEHKIEYRGSQLPQIENWQDARKFLCDYYDGAYEQTGNVINFVKDVKRRYNFG